MIFLAFLISFAQANWSGYPQAGVSILSEGEAKIKNEYCFPVVVYINGKAIEVAAQTTVNLGANSWGNWKWQAGRLTSVEQKAVKWPLKNKTTIEGGPGIGVHVDADYYAYDFMVPEGSPIFAVEGGMVIRTVSMHSINHRNKMTKDNANGVEILHADGTVARYFHLKFNSVWVKNCQQILAGQEIGLSGNTGYSMAPHLHVDVYKAVNNGYKTLPMSFSN